MPTAGNSWRGYANAYACGMKDKQWGINDKVIVKVRILTQFV